MKAIVLASAVVAATTIPLATTVSAGTPIITLGAVTGSTTTGAVVNFTWNANGDTTDPYFIEAFYEPSGTPITGTSPQATDDAFTTAGQSGPFTIVVDQLQPNTTYNYELEAFCNGCGHADHPEQQPAIEWRIRLLRCDDRPGLPERQQRYPGSPGATSPHFAPVQLVEPHGTRAAVRDDEPRAPQPG
jgi:hypothetical protein